MHTPAMYNGRRLPRRWSNMFERCMHSRMFGCLGMPGIGHGVPDADLLGGHLRILQYGGWYELR